MQFLSDRKIIIVTPTYDRNLRKQYLQRCIHCFRLIKQLLWIVVEDDADLDSHINRLLNLSGIEHVYLCFGRTRCWGNHQRNFALKYIRDHQIKGIVYLADDDNAYDVRLFDEIRKTRKVSVFPVGGLGPNGIERPIVNDGMIVSWDADWLERKYPVDMAGFAFHSDLLKGLGNEPWPFCPEDKRRGGETEFLERIVPSCEDFEVLCDQGTKCYVWHNQPLGESVWAYRLKNTVRMRLGSFKKFIKRIWHSITEIVRK